MQASIGGVTAKGVPVEWYARFGLEPGSGESWNDLDVIASAAGTPNWAQYMAGLDPTDAKALFQILAVRYDSGMARVEWRGGTNGLASDYMIQSAPAPEGPWPHAGSSP